MSLQAELIAKIKQLPPHQQLLVKSLVDELARGRGEGQPVSPGNWFGALEHLVPRRRTRLAAPGKRDSKSP